jgi:hypothetical protein
MLCVSVPFGFMLMARRERMFLIYCIGKKQALLPERNKSLTLMTMQDFNQ